ncbi:MAG: peptidoglycan-binding protein, partial [Rhizobiaceae bacterium]|nr:peptidoglycan-binding protein [Rhizobiaceae bacterium]
SLTAFDNLEMRLEEITRAVVALSHSDQATDSIERVEARINELSRLIGGMESGVSSFVSGDAQLSHRLDEIAQRLDAMSELSQASNTGFEADNNNLAALQEISERLEQLDSKVQSVQGAGEFGQLLSNPEILENLKQLSNSAEALNSKTNEGVQTESIEKLEADVGHIISILEKAPLNNDESADYVEFTKKLSSIEEQLASNRDISIEMATQVAQDTVEQVMAQVGAGSGMESTESSALSILSGLSEDIHKLQEASTHTNSQNLDAFSAIKDTLGSMVERLSTLEQDATVQAQVTAQPTPEYTAPAPAEPVIQQEVTEPVPVLNEPVEEEVPSIPSIDEFDEPVRLGGVQKEEKATGQDMVAEYRALVSEKKEVEVKPEPQQVSVAQSLVEEAARAEEERKKLRASMNPAASGDRESAGAALVENDREFHSAEMAIETFDEEDVLPPLPVAETPELTTPTPLEDSPSIDVDVEVEDRPLEPGSAGPDLAALVRKANETRKNRSKKGEGSSGTDFIAAARRAAQAAAEEASAAHDEVVKQEKESGKSVLGSIPGLFSRRKKVISMAAVATLLAAMSVPLIISAFNPGENHRLVEVNDENTVVETVKDETKVEPLVNAPRVVEAAPEPLDEPRISVASLGGIQSGETDTMRSSTSIDTRTWLEDLTYVNDALKKAVAEAQVEAIYEVGRRHLEGIGVEKSAGKALEWYMRAAELGYAPAQYIVANLNEKAIGVQRNIPEAMKWYEKAAASGNVVSMHNLAVLNATPNPATGEPDTATAFKWFKKAAEFGVRDSLVNLGIFYTKGVGTEVDLVEAYKWFTLAGKAGDEDAVKKREVVAEYMRPDQLELAKSRIEDWRPAEKNITANVYAPDPSWQPAVASAPIDDSPEAVKKAQTLLGRLGYDAGPADGIMGARTKQAIAEFQQRVGLSVSGELSTELLSELEAVAI